MFNPQAAGAGDELEPTVEEIRAFTIEYDGMSRPDLVTRWTRLTVVLSDTESLDSFKSTLAASDLGQLSTFRQRLVEGDQEHNNRFAQMFQRLCLSIRSLDGQAIGREVQNIDRITAERRERLVQTLLDDLSPDGARKVMEQAAKASVRVRGTFTDIEGVTKAFPDYVKEQYTQRCIAFGYIPEQPDN